MTRYVSGDASRFSRCGAAVLLALLSWSFCIASEQEQQPSPLSLLGRYNDGFELTSEDNRFSLNLSLGIQLRYSFVAYDEVVLGNEKDYSNIYMRRARIWFKGHAYDPRFTYYIHVQLEPSNQVNAHDIWLKYRFSDLFQVGVGRNKIPYGLEFLNSGFGLGLVERSLMYGETDIDVGGGGSVFPGGGTARFSLHSEAEETGFATGGLCLYRSQGLQIEGRKGRGDVPTFEYQVGVWQGRRSRGASNRSGKHLSSLRAGFYPFGFIDWRSQGDGTPTTKPKLGVVVSTYHQAGEKGGGFDEWGYNLAMLHRWRGFSADAEWGTEVFDYSALDDNLERSGWRVQLGYFVLPKKVEVVSRWAAITRLEHPTQATAVASGLGLASVWRDGQPVPALEREIAELTLGANIFLNDWHHHKLQLDVSRLTRTFTADPSAGIAKADDQVDLRFRALIQLKL